MQCATHISTRELNKELSSPTHTQDMALERQVRAKTQMPQCSKFLLLMRNTLRFDSVTQLPPPQLNSSSYLPRVASERIVKRTPTNRRDDSSDAARLNCSWNKEKRVVDKCYQHFRKGERKTYKLLSGISKSTRHAEHSDILAGKRDPQLEKDAQEWIEAVLGKKFRPGESFEDVLRDGQVLCEVMNKISPGSIPKINKSGGQFKMMENINVFQQALKAYGVNDVDVFQTVDLWEKKDISQVTSTIFALGRTTYKHPEWTGPYLGPKPSDECKRDFTDEQLKSGQTIIGLQAGQNKGATQAGSNMGAGRKILLNK
uniref:Calponin-homology (CH) domain-containing protein n=1 Tax=Timema bartmani TaxID=61472 RepID=A0A7R9I5B1_9NEOP|nr:unnamed protein product [Timema bartmani]